jgi:hypothetical protein
MLKKTLFFLLFLFISSPSIFCQKIDLGFKGGIGKSEFLYEAIAETPSAYFDTNPISSYSAGVTANIKIKGILNLQPEILYRTKGVKFNFYHSLSRYDASNTWTYNLSYLEIPILMKLSFFEDANINPYLLLGPSFNFLLGAKLKTSYVIPEIGNDLDRKRGFDTFDLGLIPGAGVEYKYNAGAVSFEVRYEYGYDYINNEYLDFDGSIRNSDFSIYLGLTHSFSF